MMQKTKTNILIITVFSVFIMSLTDGWINPGYINKSLIKIVLFLLVPIIYTKFDNRIKFKDIFYFPTIKSLIKPLLIGLAIYVGIVFVYFVLSRFIDLAAITKILNSDVGVEKDNFIKVALYISFINSFIEEFFFRGFIFLNLKNLASRKFAYVFSATAFSIYHVAIMGSWFSPALFIIAMLGLFVGGLIFNYLNEKSGNIYNSWLVHMMANLAINTVGLIMFGII